MIPALASPHSATTVSTGATMVHAASGLARRSGTSIPGVGIVIFILGWAISLPAAEPAVSFSRDVLPIFSDNCFQCHGPDEKARKGKLRLDTKDGAFRVKDGVAIIEPKHSAQSELYRRMTSADPDDVMPPVKSKRQLTPQQIATVRSWIDQGAHWGEHWAFEKLSRPELPLVSAGLDRARNPIDRFLLARLAKEGLTFSPEAPKETLVRRATLDLTGLPPTLDESEAFFGDPSPQAYEKLVDRLLESPAFGERMAWDWLEAARYADSNGYQGDGERTMWPWRDWVVEAFNRNLPYDQFSTWQLAGDQLPNPSPEQRLATGFLRNHPINGEGGRIPEENRVDYVMDMAETTGTVWLGLTLNCCRCHDHKFDPLSKRDYYSWFAFFNQTPVDGGGGDPQAKPNLELPTADQTARLAQIDSVVRTAGQDLDQLERAFFLRPKDQTAADSDRALNLPANLRSTLKAAASRRNRNQLAELETEFEKSSPEYVSQVRKLREALDDRDRVNRAIVRVMVMQDLPNPRKTFLLEKGLYDKRGDEVTAAFPARLAEPEAARPRHRLDLARWLTSPNHPLTARVTVNRLWQQFFGLGLVKTPEDFGVQGAPPMHPELLDWLASELVGSGWNIKHLCRLIVTSAAYRQSSKMPAVLAERDPENRLLARGPRFRMPSWMIRDQALAASGLLTRRLGGPPVKPYQPAGVWEEATFGTKKYVPDRGESLYRRSLYTFWRRIVGPTMFFDTASREVCTVKPLRTNSPLHALATLDDVTYVEAARALAEQVLTQAGSAVDERLNWAFRRLLARRPASDELQVLRESLARLTREYAAAPDAARRLLAVGESPRAPRFDPIEHAAYTGLCSILLNLDETLTKE